MRALGPLPRPLVRRLRPPKLAVEPFLPQGWHLEEERTPEGCSEPALTVFLTGSECPFCCVFCDLWQYTLEGPTPPGALAVQVRQALQEAELELPRGRWGGSRLKLYNASNFFQHRAVPPVDAGRLLETAKAFGRVVVESHPRLVGEACFDFAHRLGEEGSVLEVAMGLETVHPEALPRLGKGMTLEDFQRAAEGLNREGIPFRAFVLLGAPYVPLGEAVEWAVRSAEWAFSEGAEAVSIIPLRDGNGAVEVLVERGQARLPTLLELEEALDACCRLGRGIAVADLWDIGRLAACETCRAARVERLRRQNLSGEVEERVGCGVCAAAS